MYIVKYVYYRIMQDKPNLHYSQKANKLLYLID